MKNDELAVMGETAVEVEGKTNDGGDDYLTQKEISKAMAYILIDILHDKKMINESTYKKIKKI